MITAAAVTFFQRLSKLARTFSAVDELSPSSRILPKSKSKQLLRCDELCTMIAYNFIQEVVSSLHF